MAKVQAPTPEEVAGAPEGVTVVSFLAPAAQLDTVKALVATKATAFSLDLLPRISRAQSMDALSSQSTVSGYRAALAAAERLPKFFPMFMTAAGTVPPAKVLVLGAGVAGLQTIATARRLGAQVRAYDVRAAAKEEVQSLGATFVELGLESQEGSGGYAREQSEDFLAQQRELIGNEVAASDVVITTAAVPGRTGPHPRHHGHGGPDGRGIGHRRPGRRLRRATARSPRRAATSSTTGSRWPASPIPRRPCPPTPASSTPATSSTSSALVIPDGELTPRLRRRDRGRLLRGPGRGDRPRAHP